MTKRTKYIIAALAVVVVVSNVMFATKARNTKPTVAGISSADFHKSVPADVHQLRERLEAASAEYNKAVKPYNQRLVDLTDELLSAEEAEKLLAEVEKETGEKERAMNDLRKQYNARMAGLLHQHRARSAR